MRSTAQLAPLPHLHDIHGCCTETLTSAPRRTWSRETRPFAAVLTAGPHGGFCSHNCDAWAALDPALVAGGRPIPANRLGFLGSAGDPDP